VGFKGHGHHSTNPQSFVVGIRSGSMTFDMSPEALWRPSPNWIERTDGVDVIVLHATVLDSLEEVVLHFTRESPGVSAHYTIDRDGTVAQHVDEANAAFHAGESEMPDGRRSVNDFSIGVELVNRNDGVDPYAEAQIEALNRLISGICSRHPIRHIVSHAEIARPLGRKSDPNGLDFSRVLSPPAKIQAEG
jgi:N-acetylmuramoyl-L-alanine amidase